MVTWVDLTNSGQLDPLFPYPLAFETCYNLAVKFLDAFSLLSNFLLAIIIILVLVLLTRILWVLIR